MKPKFEVVLPADQTIVMWAGVGCGGGCEPWTVDHKIAKLFDSREAAELEMLPYYLDGRYGELEINEVTDEEEYRSREDTW